MAETAQQSQLAAIIARINQLHATVGKDAAALDEHLVQPFVEPNLDGKDASDLNNFEASIVDLENNLLHEFERLKTATDAFDHAVVAAKGALTDRAAKWSEEFAALQTAMTNLEHAAGDGANGASTALTDLGNGIVAGRASVVELGNHLKESATSVGHTIVETTATTLSKAAHDYQTSVESVLQVKAIQHVGSIYEHAGAALTSIGDTATNVTQHFGDQAKDAMHSFASGVVSGITDDLEKAAERLARDAMEALATQIATAIAQSVAGAAVTGAMSPILPEVIIAKEALPVIADLIEVWKTLTTLGGIL